MTVDKQQKEDQRTSSSFTWLKGITWLHAVVFVIVILLGLLGYFESRIWDHQNDRLTGLESALTTLHAALEGIDTKIQSFQNESESIARLEERLKSLERAVYKTRAEAAGFKNPAIVATSLEANQQFEARTLTAQGEYVIKFKVIGYNPSQKILRLTFDGILGGSELASNSMTIPNVQPGVLTELPRLFENLPRLFVFIVDVPSAHHVVLAIGSHKDSSSKNS